MSLPVFRRFGTPVVPIHRRSYFVCGANLIDFFIHLTLLFNANSMLGKNFSRRYFEIVFLFFPHDRLFLENAQAYVIEVGILTTDLIWIIYILKKW